jgi:hypothetical protein
LIWNITIQDPDGDDFDWWINCSSGDKNWKDDTNGSKFVLIFTVNYSTTYIVWVNATDGYNWTRHVYIVMTAGIPTVTTFIPIVQPLTIFLVIPLTTALFMGGLLGVRRRRRRRDKM